MKIAIIIALLFSLNVGALPTLKVTAPFLPGNFENDGKEGREAEMVNLIFDCMNVKPEYDIQPFFRHIKSFSYNKTNPLHFDAVLCVPQGHSLEGHHSEFYIRYYNGAFVRQSKFPQDIKSLKDLKGKHVVTFVDGLTLLEGLAANKHHFATYVESSDQVNHVKMLLKDRVDVVFSDSLIFLTHYKRLIKQDPKLKKDIRFYKLFGPLKFKAVFKDSKLRDKFNSCYRKLAKEGILDKIELKFAKEFKDSLGTEYFQNLSHSQE